MSEDKQRPDRCETCKYWTPPVPDNRHEFKGQCRYMPPAISNGLRCWPETYATEWCGQHKYHEAS